MRRHSGFTLVELVITLAVSGIVVSFIAMFIAGPVRGYTDQTRRVRLVDLAEVSLRRMGRDVRRALPNSVRIGGSGAIVALEMLNTVDGVRYRAGPPPANPDAQLDFTTSDTRFNSVGTFAAIAKPFSSTIHYLSVYNVGAPGANAYELANVITPPGTQIDIDTSVVPGEDNVVISPGFQFAFESPAQRLFLIDGPVAYLCDPVGGTIVRYTDYTIAADQTTRDSAAELLGAGAMATVMANRVSACRMDYAAGTAQRAGLVSLELTLSDSGESVSLLHQVHVDNVP